MKHFQNNILRFWAIFCFDQIALKFKIFNYFQYCLTDNALIKKNLLYSNIHFPNFIISIKQVFDIIKNNLQKSKSK